MRLTIDPPKRYAAEDEDLARSLIRQVLCEIRGAWAPFDPVTLRGAGLAHGTVDPRRAVRAAATAALGLLDTTPLPNTPEPPKPLYGPRKADSDASTFAGWMRLASNWYDIARATTYIRRRPPLDRALVDLARKHAAFVAWVARER